MTDRIAWLRWSLAIVLAIGAARLLVAIATAGHPGVALPMGIAVGAAELAGAVLLLVPASRRAGGTVLLAVLAIAALLHAHAGEAPPLAFAVYATATLATMQARPR